MNILLTGSAGFIGSHVKRKLMAAGHAVTGVDNFDARVHPALAYSGTSYKHIPYSTFTATDVVIHLAAQVSVLDSMHDPLRYIDQNTRDTADMLLTLEMAHANTNQPKRLVVASSMSVYGEGGHLVTERDAVCPASVYGLTKYDQERLCLMWGSKLGIPSFALRFFNVYGPGQALHNPYTGVLANFAQRLLHDQEPIVYEDGEQTRDFIYVEDVADAVVAAATTDVHQTYWHKPYNICTGRPTTIAYAARALARALGKQIEPRITGTTRDGDIRHCTGSPAAAGRAFGFYPTVPFDDGITHYATWLRDHSSPS